MTLASLIILSFAWFLTRAVPSVYYGDCGEILSVLHVGGVPHPTGFPAYLLLATLLDPFGTFAVNSLSSMAAAMSVALVYLLARRLSAHVGMEYAATSRHALAAAIFLLGSSTLCLNGASARVYTLQLAFWIALCILAVGFRPTLAWSLGWGFLFGLSSGTHLLFLAAVPFALPFAWGRIRNSLPRILPGLGTGLALGASLQLWIPLRSALNPVINWGDPSNFTRWGRYLTQASYQRKMFARDAEGTQLFLNDLGRILSVEWIPLTWVLAVLGFAWLLRKNQKAAAAFFLTALFNLTLLYFYGGEFDLAMLPRYFLPLYALAALSAAFVWAAWWERKAPVSWRSPRASFMALGVLAAVCMVFPAVRWHDLPRSTTCWNYALALFRSVPRNGILEVAGDFQTFPVAYAQHAKHLRPDLKVVDFNETVFPEAGRRLRTTPGLTRDALEREYLDQGGGELFVPNNRWVPPPWSCREWGMTYRISIDPPGRKPPVPPSMEPMRARFTESDISDGEAQETVSVCLYQKAAWDASRGNREKALEGLGEIERRCGRSANALVNAGVLYQRLGAMDKVESPLLKALKLRPHHYTANLNLGIIYGSKNDFTRARERFLTASRAVPDDVAAREYLKLVEAKLNALGGAR